MNNKTVSETEERNKEESSFQFLFSTPPPPDPPLTSCMYTDLLALSTYHAYNRFMS